MGILKGKYNVTLFGQFLFEIPILGDLLINIRHYRLLALVWVIFLMLLRR